MTNKITYSFSVVSVLSLANWLACGEGKTWEEENTEYDENDDGDDNGGEEDEGGGLKEILEAYPAVIDRVDDFEKWTPLHCAVASSHYTSRATIEKLLELGPDAAHVVDCGGRTPFHVAVESGRAWEDGLDVLFEANPDAIDAPDAARKIPIVAALLRYCEYDNGSICAKDSNSTVDTYDYSSVGNYRQNGLKMLAPSSLDSTESLDSSPSRPTHLLPLEEEPHNDDASEVERSFQGNTTNPNTSILVGITAADKVKVQTNSITVDGSKCSDYAITMSSTTGEWLASFDVRGNTVQVGIEIPNSNTSQGSD